MDLKLKDCTKLKLTHSLITELEYIQSSEGQYIIIPLKPTSKMTYECHAEMSETAECTVFMSRTNTGNQLGIMLNGSKKLSLSYHSVAVGGNKNYVFGKVYYHSAIENNKYAVYYNNTKAGETNINNSFSNNYNICIFGRNTAGIIATYTGAVVKLYDLKFYNDAGELVMDLVPCKDTNGVVCLYDVVSETYHYNSASGEFIAGPLANVRNLSTYNTNLLEKITSLYVKDCPNILSFGLLFKILEVQASIQNKLSRVRLNIGTQTGSLNFLMKLVGLNGFNDNYEQQVKPRLIGTYTINDYYFPDDLVSAQQAIDGLTIVVDNNYALSSNMLAVQTLDPEAENYNPAVAIILANNGIGTVLDEPKIQGGGRYYLPKVVAANIRVESIFSAIETVIDSNAIVINDSTISYDFEYFNEFKYFYPELRSGSANNITGSFQDCKKLKELTFPNGLLRGDTRACFNLLSLEKLTLPAGFYNVASMYFGQTNAELISFYIDNLLDWFNLSVSGYNNEIFTSENKAIYVANVKLINIIMPDGVTSLRNDIFRGAIDIESVTFNNSVTSIGGSAFKDCTSLTGNLVIPNNVTSIGNDAFMNCSNLNYIEIQGTTITYGNYAIFTNATKLGMLYAKGNLKGGNFGVKTLYVKGDLEKKSTLFNNNWINDNITIRIARIKGTFKSIDSYGFGHNGSGTVTSVMGFIELYFVDSTGTNMQNHGRSYKQTIIHFANSNKICDRIKLFPDNYNPRATTFMNAEYISKVYVGTGESRAADQATLALYQADTNGWGDTTSNRDWASKLDIWYDYHGEYRNYNSTYNLTNVTCSNVLEWPYPIRNDSYETELIPDDGYTLSTVQVTMLDTDSTSPTYDTMVDITSSVYDSLTNTISIPAITGDIVITATAVANS